MGRVLVTMQHGLLPGSDTNQPAIVSEGDEIIALPPLRWPSADHFSANGIFIIDAAAAIWIRLGESVAGDILSDLFDVVTVKEVTEVCANLPPGTLLPVHGTSRPSGSCLCLCMLACVPARW